MIDESWLTRTARFIDQGRGEADELAQEGRIEAWRAAERYRPGLGTTPESWARAAAVRRMKDISWHTGQPFGHEPVRGHQEPKKAALTPAVENVASWEPSLDVAGEVQAAVAELPSRARRWAELRFWDELTYAEIEAELGKGASSYFTKRVRPQLAQALAHLRRS